MTRELFILMAGAAAGIAVCRLARSMEPKPARSMEPKPAPMPMVSPPGFENSRDEERKQTKLPQWLKDMHTPPILPEDQWGPFEVASQGTRKRCPPGYAWAQDKSGVWMCLPGVMTA